jgi:hypothetical protein
MTAGRDFFERFVAALNSRDFDAVESMLHPDLIADNTQSGERARGREAFMVQFRNFPEATDDDFGIKDAQLLGDDERWAITPAYTVVPLADPGKYTTVLRTKYPDGTWWWNVSIAELRDGMLYRLESFFAPEMPAPLVESIASYQHG